MYGHNFAYFDPNIWYHEDEMRKQVEQLNGKFIMTGAYEDIDRDGIFAKDQDLECFLTSPWAICAALQLQHAFEAQHNQQECAQMIEDYVQWGGDHGLTESTMREACGLPPRDMRAISNRAQAIIQVDDDDKDVDKDPDKKWDLLRKFFVSHLLELRRPDITKPMLLRLKAPGGPNLTKENLIKELVNNKILAETSARGKTAEVYRPLLTCSNLQKVVAFKQKHLEMVLPETLQARGFVEYVQGCPARRENALVLGRFFCAAKSPPLRGRPSKTDAGALDKSDACQERGRKLLEQEKLFDEILRELIKLTGDRAPASTQEAQPAERRRIKSKELLKVKEESDDVKPFFVPNISIADVQETLHTQRAYV
ncbi:unnamed protein product [Symbiodinium necroappetens]|uniref:Uncharacterized protein n=1 Tax=Symbiodinium necroappetens TaxID=1628268 RepID=A0A812VIV2_9DINO|nr:unnamed protein product [Symbiodinium necroappetens]